MDRLPPELILLIHQHLDPQSTFHLALMSRLIASHSCDALALHRRRAATYGTVSGLNASAVQAVMDDEALAWHVRCLELWDWRGGVDELRAYGYCGGLGQDDGADDAWTVRMRERVQDLPAVALALEGFQLPPDRDGLQVLLVLSCPRVRQLKDFRTMDRRADTVREIWYSLISTAGDPRYFRCLHLLTAR